MNRLSIIVRHSRTFSERKLQELDIRFPEQLVLMRLNDCRQANQDSIASYFSIDKGAITKTLGKLEEKELVIRQPNPENKRENLIFLTDRGKKAIKKMGSTLKEWDTGLFKGLTKEETQEFKRMINIMTDNAIELIRSVEGDTNVKTK